MDSKKETDVIEKTVQENTWVWVVTSYCCSDCGGYISNSVFSDEPTDEDIKNNEDIIGGMFCIRTAKFKVQINGDAVHNSDLVG